MPALLAARPCPARVQADNGTADLGPEGSCPDAPQPQVACKTRQVQGVAQSHTAREVGKSHGPTTLPAIVEGRAPLSGTQPTGSHRSPPTGWAHTQAVTRLRLDPGGIPGAGGTTEVSL